MKFTGDANGAPITLDVKTGIKDLLSRDEFSFDADVTYNVLHLTAQGKADVGSSSAEVSAYQLTAGKTTIKGDVAATWNGPRPNAPAETVASPREWTERARNRTEGDTRRTDRAGTRADGASAG